MGGLLLAGGAFLLEPRLAERSRTGTLVPVREAPEPEEAEAAAALFPWV